MPVITKSTYRVPWFIQNRHLQTIIPHFIRKVKVESSKRERITTPDKDFLGTLCYPVEQARKNSNFWLETPLKGGHVGFLDFHPTNYYWSERRALSFIGVC